MVTTYEPLYRLALDLSREPGGVPGRRCDSASARVHVERAGLQGARQWHVASPITLADYAAHTAQIVCVGDHEAAVLLQNVQNWSSATSISRRPTAAAGINDSGKMSRYLRRVHARVVHILGLGRRAFRTVANRVRANIRLENLKVHTLVERIYSGVFTSSHRRSLCRQHRHHRVES